MDRNTLRKMLEPFGQQHVLAFWEDLDQAGRQRLAHDICQLDLNTVNQLCQLYLGGETSHRQSWAQLAQRAQSPPSFRLGDDNARFTLQEARQRGETALRAGQLAFILVAGGQGTRLGFDQPKGMFPIGPVSKRSLLEILVERLHAIRQRYGAPVPLYVMTSPATDEATDRYLQQQQYFGLPPEDVRLFCQGTMPAVDQQGKILLTAKDRLALAPDGHGGMLAAFARSGCLQDAAQRGIEHLFYGQVDNPLLQICDPALVGYHLLSESEMTSQVVAKTHPLERVGNLVSIDGKMHVIEYSDLPDELATETTADGALRFWAGSIAVHIVSRAFLDRVKDQADALPFHVAHKRVKYIDSCGRPIDPQQPNALKFERFIFDLLPHARNAIAVECDRREAFAPVKNTNDAGVDCPATAQQLMVALYRRWLQQAGAVVRHGVAVEISAQLALDAQQLKSRIQPGLVIDRDMFLKDALS